MTLSSLSHLGRLVFGDLLIVRVSAIGCCRQLVNTSAARVIVHLTHAKRSFPRARCAQTTRHWHYQLERACTHDWCCRTCDDVAATFVCTVL